MSFYIILQEKLVYFDLNLKEFLKQHTSNRVNVLRCNAVWLFCSEASSDHVLSTAAMYNTGEVG